jgi:hypothetical protein
MAQRHVGAKMLVMYANLHSKLGLIMHMLLYIHLYHVFTVIVNPNGRL